MAICNVLASACGISTHSTGPHTDPIANTPRDEKVVEFEVYGALIDAFFQGRLNNEKIFVSNRSIFGRVSPDNSQAKVVAFLEEQLEPGLSKELIEEFQEANKYPKEIPSRFDTTVPYVMYEEGKSVTVNGITYSDITTLPGSRVYFSQLGLTSDRKNALVYLASYGGMRTGWGYYVVLTDKNGQWRVKQKFQVWIA